VQVFLSGAMFPMPVPALFILGSHQVGWFDIFPATHAMIALQQVLTGGAGLETVAFRLGATLLLSVLYFILGVWVFSIKQRGR
jgi:ABC-2 type transport system permease protein